MEQILDFFDPVNLDNIVNFNYDDKSLFLNKITINSTKNKKIDFTKIKIAIIGTYNLNETDSNNISNNIRKNLYSLFLPYNVSIIDFGNLKCGKTQNDTIYGIREVLNILNRKKITAIIIGNSSNITFGAYLSFEEIKKPVNIVSVDSKINLKHKNIEENNIHFLPKIILKKNNCLFNYSLLGYQSYFVSPIELSVLSRLYFDTMRLGILQSNIADSEPFFRDADIASFNINSIKGSLLNSNTISPNGIDTKEFCQLSKYSGTSNRLSSFCIYGDNYNDSQVMLAAQAIWYFIEGFTQRKYENPQKKSNSIIKFYVEVGKDTSITFYKSKITERWWMEIPYPKSKFEKHLIVSCSYSDYNKACTGNVPDRWWKFFQKIC